MERLPSGLASTRWPGPGCWPPISGSRAGRHLAAGAARPASGAGHVQDAGAGREAVRERPACRARSARKACDI